MRRNDVASTLFRRRVPIRFLINQRQIITFLILKYDIIENSRIELRGIVLPVQMSGLLGGPLAPPLPTLMIVKLIFLCVYMLFLLVYLLKFSISPFLICKPTFGELNMVNRNALSLFVV